MRTTPLGERLGQLRRRAGLTKSALATKARLDPTTVYRLEAGLHKGTSVRVRRGLAHALGIPKPKLSAYLDGYLDLDEVIPDYEFSRVNMFIGTTFRFDVDLTLPAPFAPSVGPVPTARILKMPSVV